MKFVFRTFILLISLVMFMLMTACTLSFMHQTDSNIADTKQRIEEARQKSDASNTLLPPLLINQGLYVDKTPVDLARHPSWLKNQIVLRGDQLPFSYFARSIAAAGGRNILVNYQADMDQSTLLSLNYCGTVQGALNFIAAKTGYFYFVNGRNIMWQAYITKSYEIAFMPGSSDYMMGKASSGSGSMTSGGSGGTSNNPAGTSMTVTGLIDDSASSQYSNLKGTLSIWKDLKTTIEQMLTSNGKVIVSEATTSVTVRDKPMNVEMVGKYIANLNNNISKQVMVKVQILDISLSNDFMFGINWDVIGQIFRSTQYVLNAQNNEPISIQAIGNDAINTLNTTINTGHGNSVNALINALNQQGRTSVVNEPRVVCLNNQVCVVRIVNQNGYLASIQNTTVAGAAGASATAGTITSQVTPGSLITGLTLYILPKILDDKVFLQVNADLSDNLGFQTVGTGNSSSPNFVQIQVPNVSQKQFNQRSIIRSGDTLILSGFRRIKNQTGTAQLFNSTALGGQAAQQSNVETIVLITPIVLHSIG